MCIRDMNKINLTLVLLIVGECNDPVIFRGLASLSRYEKCFRLLTRTILLLLLPFTLSIRFL